MRVHNRLSFRCRRILRQTKEIAELAGAAAGLYIACVVQSTIVPVERELMECAPELTRGIVVMLIAFVIVGGVTYIENKK